MVLIFAESNYNTCQGIIANLRNIDEIHLFEEKKLLIHRLFSHNIARCMQPNIWNCICITGMRRDVVRMSGNRILTFAHCGDIVWGKITVKYKIFTIPSCPDDWFDYLYTIQKKINKQKHKVIRCIDTML